MLRIACIALLACSLAGAAEPEIGQLTELAEAGNAEAMVKLGMRYRDGDGVERDHETAVKWYRKAVDAGSTVACDHLGFMYLRGWGVDTDFAEANRLFHRSKDNPQALYNVGRIYGEGLGVPIDRARAEAYWDVASRLGNPHAPLHAALQEWNTVQEFNLKVDRFLTRAIELNNPTAMRWSDYIDIRTGRHTRARLSVRAHEIRPIDDPERRSVSAWAKLRKRASVPGRFAFIDLPHRTQGLNMCGPTAAALALSSDTNRVDPYEVKAKCTGSPRGTGTDWALLVAAIREYGRKAEIVTFTHDDAGFEKGTAALRAQLDAGRPTLIDVIEPSRQSKSAHTVIAVGYDEEAGQWILHDPAVGPPGLWIVSNERFKVLWHSRWWTKTSTGYARPMITISR